MNLQHLRHFLVLAEELHFGRAALRLHIAQPPLSQSLARLEASLGFQLFERTRRSVLLTDAGAVFLREVRPALAQLERAVQLAEKANAGQLLKLNLGFASGALTEALPRTMRAIEGSMPDTEIALHELTTTQQVDGLLDGSLDAGLIFEYLRHETDIHARVIARYAPFVAIPAAWPLSRKKRLTLRDMADLPFIVFPPDQDPIMYYLLIAECQRHGFSIKIKQTITRIRTMIGLVSAGIGVALVDQASAEQGYPGVVFRPIDGLPPEFTSELSLAWLAQPATPIHEAALLALADKLAVPELSTPK